MYKETDRQGPIATMFAPSSYGVDAWEVTTAARLSSHLAHLPAPPRASLQPRARL